MKKKKDSDEEDSTYVPTPQEKKKKVIKKQKAIQTGVMSRSTRARKETASMPKSQGGKVPEDETSKILEVENVKASESEKLDDTTKDQNVQSGFYSTTIPVNPTIQIHDDAEKSPEQKIDEKEKSSDSAGWIPNIPGNIPHDLPEDDYDIFNNAKINMLTKKVSTFEKEKVRAITERDELKKELKVVKAVNAEMKSVVNDHAERIDKLIEDLEEQAKAINIVNDENDKLYAANKALHQMIAELLDTSTNENKVLKLEIEALRADKVVKDEHLNMLYVVYNDLEVHDREKVLVLEAKQKKKGLFVDSEEILGSSSNPESNILDAVEYYDRSWDDYKDIDDDQGSTRLLIVKPSVQHSLDDFLNDEINEQQEDQHQESSSSSSKHHTD
ncbi:hypothetical protein Hanom_Chr06g00563531 [Helianthus anomalus]